MPATPPSSLFQGPGRNGQPGPRRTAGARLCAEDVVLQLRHRPCGSEFQLQHHAPWVMVESKFCLFPFWGGRGKRNQRLIRLLGVRALYL